MPLLPIDALVASFFIQCALAAVVLVGLWGLVAAFGRPVHRAFAVGWAIYMVHLVASLLHALADRAHGGASSQWFLATLQFVGVLGSFAWWYAGIRVVAGERRGAHPERGVAIGTAAVGAGILLASALGGRVLHQPGTGPLGIYYPVPYLVLAWVAWRPRALPAAERRDLFWLGVAFAIVAVRLVLNREVLLPEAQYATATAPRFLLVATVQLVQTVATGMTCVAVGLSQEGRAALRQAERLHETELALQRSQRLEGLGRMTAGIAHDFNNVLAAIGGGVELARASLADPAAVRTELDAVAQAVARAQELVRRLVAFARARPGRAAAIAPDRALEAHLTVLRHLLPPGITLDAAPRAGDAAVAIDATQFEQLLLNLVVNSRDAMPRGGRIAVATAVEEVAMPLPACEGTVRPGRYFRLSVEDSGEGIPAEVLPRIFEPFFTTKPEGLGSGIGLATVYQVVQAAHGEIAVRSAPGAGTRFDVYLPLADAGPLRLAS